MILFPQLIHFYCISTCSTKIPPTVGPRKLPEAYAAVHRPDTMLVVDTDSEYPSILIVACLQDVNVESIAPAAPNPVKICYIFRDFFFAHYHAAKDRPMLTLDGMEEECKEQDQLM